MIEARRANLKRLSNIEHRLEYVEVYKGVEYINDAKATDVNSSWYSIDGLEKPIVWIINSSGDQEECEQLKEIEAANVKAIIVLGEDHQLVKSVFEDKVNHIQSAQSIYDALVESAKYAVDGDVVLYSPAFIDFNRVAGFKENGQQFRKAVREFRL